MATFNMGPKSYHVPMRLHAETRQKLVDRFAKLGNVPQGSLVLLQGGTAKYRDTTDHEELFRQESFFQYLFGVKEPECWGAIDLSSKKAYLFVPELGIEWVVWMGKIPPLADWAKNHEVDEAHFTKDLAAFLTMHFAAHQDAKLYLLEGPNTDRKETHPAPTLPEHEQFADRIDRETLWWELCECRLIKTEEELKLMRHVCQVTSEAHVHVMKNARPGVMEYQLEAEFRYHAHFHGGCRETSYMCICPSGENAAVLHYGHAGLPNNKQVQKDDMLLLDMGAEYHCYGSDVTRSFPASGKFSPQQRTIYSAVLAAQQAVMDAAKPGVKWVDMHELSYKVILEKMQQAGLVVKGVSVQELLDNDIAALFMPHGLGHLLGIDTHDVGGFLKGQTRINRPGFRSLRCYRTLEVGMVLTVEPGIYFNSVVFENAFNTPEKAKYLVREEIEKYLDFGGVRIEDDIIITATGCENMTTVPRQIEEIEAILAQNPFINPKQQ